MLSAAIISNLLPASWRTYHRHRMISLVIIFVLSGLLHGISDIIYWTSFGVRTLPVLRFFVASAAAVATEKAIASSSNLQRISARRIQPSITKKILGYIWVLAYLCFFTPFCIYPTLRQLDPDKMLLLGY